MKKNIESRIVSYGIVEKRKSLEFRGSKKGGTRSSEIGSRKGKGDPPGLGRMSAHGGLRACE